MDRIKLLTLTLILFISMSFSSDIKMVEEHKDSFEVKLHGMGLLSAKVGENSNNDSDDDYFYNYENENNHWRISLELNNKTEKTDISVKTSYEYEEFIVEQAYFGYRVNNNYTIKFGYFTMPIGRLGDCSDTGLLMYNKSPLVGYCNPNKKLGIVNEFTNEDDRFSISHYILNVYDENPFEQFFLLDIGSAMHIMPFGKMDLSETAVKGYDRIKIDISPSFYFQKIDNNHDYIEMHSMETTGYYRYFGLQTAFRYSTFSVDFIYYNKQFRDNRADFNKKYDAYSAQMAYLLWNRFQPSIRVTRYSDFCGFLIDNFNPIYYDESYRNTIYECGLYYYLPEYFLKIGLNYIKSENNLNPNNEILRVDELDEFRFSMELNLDKVF